MVKAMIDITERSNRVLNVIKAKYGFVDKSKTIDFVVKEFENEILEPQLRPEFLTDLEKIRKGKFSHFSDINKLRKEIENVRT